MHEYSIVQALIDSCEEEAEKHQANMIQNVVIKVGALSGVEPHLLELAFDAFKHNSRYCQGASLELIKQPVLIRCHCCHKESVLKNHQYHCVYCDSKEYSVIDGEEMFLMQLEMA